MEIKQFEIGVIAGNFDVIHPGYVKLFKEMNVICKNQLDLNYINFKTLNDRL